MRRRGERAPREKVAAEETKSPGRKAEQGAEEYRCSGILEQDFPELCTRAGIATVPRVTLRPSPSFPADEEPTEPTLVGVLARIERKYSYFQPCIQVEREPQDPRSTRAVFLRGWKMEEPMLGVLSQCLPTLAGLQAVQTLSLEGNPLPTPAFHTLMGSDSPLVHLSLRNNRIGDEDARLIGKGLSTLSPSGRSLASLILSFNRISDLGAAYIARGLRLNRSLLFLSLENNDIGDVGATRLAEVLAPFALTHDEVVERRRLLLAEALGQSCTTPKETKGQSEDPSSAAPDKLPRAKHGNPPPQKKGAAAEGGGQAAQEVTGAKSCPRQRSKTTPPGEAEPGGTRSGRAASPAAGRGQGAPGQRHPAGEPGAPQPQPGLQPRHRAGTRRLPGSAGGAAAGEETQGAGAGGAAVPLPGEEPHPSRQPGLGAAAGAAATAAPVARSAGPAGGGGGGGSTGHLAGPQQHPKGHLESCLFYLKNKIK
ncbi:leucine-rich repeat-containing protein 71 isoform X2 [Falco naumanni]|uniref:leucine-rich repeat-containing protein 71 isoform X2 n=1 Tax=Falco naumanni TaxID=148594 RepID=UPI001ADEA020|nr:leucine-rich repeat-containing protein 71 isoform X2 [Falco naumanni]